MSFSQSIVAMGMVFGPGIGSGLAEFGLMMPFYVAACSSSLGLLLLVCIMDNDFYIEKIEPESLEPNVEEIRRATITIEETKEQIEDKNTELQTVSIKSNNNICYVFVIMIVNMCGFIILGILSTALPLFAHT